MLLEYTRVRQCDVIAGAKNICKGHFSKAIGHTPLDATCLGPFHKQTITLLGENSKEPQKKQSSFALFLSTEQIYQLNEEIKIKFYSVRPINDCCLK